MLTISDLRYGSTAESTNACGWMQMWQLDQGNSMLTIVIRLDPRLLDNPDTDLRYRLPELLAERTSGLISDDGYDYVGEVPLMDVFLTTADPQPALACILDVVQNVRVMGNDLRSAVIAIERDGGHEVVYPPDFTGPFAAQRMSED